MSLHGRKGSLTYDEGLALFEIQRILKFLEACPICKTPKGVLHEILRPDRIKPDEPGFAGCVEKHFKTEQKSVPEGALANLFLQIAASWRRIKESCDVSQDRAEELYEVAINAAAHATDLGWHRDESLYQQLRKKTHEQEFS